MLLGHMAMDHKNGMLPWSFALHSNHSLEKHSLIHTSRMPLVFVEIYRYDDFITPEAPWDHVLNTGQNQVAGKTRRLEPWECLEAKFQ